VADRSFTPPDAPVARYLAMLDAVGFRRGVLVQGSVHGADNRVTLKAVQTAPDRLRGVAVIGPDTAENEIAALDAAGFRGTRMSTVVRGGPGFGNLEEIAAKVRSCGWHLVVHVNKSEELVALAPRLLATGLTIVVDHIARITAEEGTGARAWPVLLDLLATGRGWVKLSALHRTSRAAFPWGDMTPLVQGVLHAAPDRVLWGTDWPHPNHYDEMPNDGDLVDAFAAWVTDPELRERVLVQNPAALYGFPS
jgi:predicted TIM-barrel fold metal-dependent hydrolase